MLNSLSHTGAGRLAHVAEGHAVQGPTLARPAPLPLALGGAQAAVVVVFVRYDSARFGRMIEA